MSNRLEGGAAMLKEMKTYWLCVGAANMDMQGVTTNRFLPATSNPGVVQQVAGGIARNVAENLAWLGEKVHLCALTGDDSDGEWLRLTTAQSGVNTQGMHIVSKQTTGRYLVIRDRDGDVYSAVSDMNINEYWTTKMVDDGRKRLKKASGLFLDANLPEQVIHAFLHEAKLQGKMVVADPVSVKKAGKFKKLVKDVYILTTSIDELEMLCGQTLHSFHDVEQSAQQLIEQGLRQIIVSCGEAGLCMAGHDQPPFWLSAPALPLREKTKDAFIAGIIYAQNKTKSLTEQATYGVALAELSLGHSSTYDLEKYRQQRQACAQKLLKIGYQ